MYLLDTDHCVFLLRNVETVRRQFEQRASARSAVSIVTVAELLFGAYWSSRPHENAMETNRLVDTLTVLPLTRPAADRFARIKADLFRAGRKLEDPDLFIAATALEHELALVTHNISHYERIPGLRLEDWYEKA